MRDAYRRMRWGSLTWFCWCFFSLILLGHINNNYNVFSPSSPARSPVLVPMHQIHVSSLFACLYDVLLPFGHLILTFFRIISPIFRQLLVTWRVFFFCKRLVFPEYKILQWNRRRWSNQLHIKDRFVLVQRIYNKMMKRLLTDGFGV